MSCTRGIYYYALFISSRLFLTSTYSEQYPWLTSYKLIASVARETLVAPVALVALVATIAPSALPPLLALYSTNIRFVITFYIQFTCAEKNEINKHQCTYDKNHFY